MTYQYIVLKSENFFRNSSGVSLAKLVLSYYIIVIVFVVIIIIILIIFYDKVIITIKSKAVLKKAFEL